MTLTINDIQHINALAHRHHKNNQEIAAETGYSLTDIDRVIRGTYVDDLTDQWKDDANITLAEYDAIRHRYKPGKLHRDTEYMIARDMLIRPETVLAIVHSRFSNTHTHPVPKPAKKKPTAPEAIRRVYTPDLDEVFRLNKFGWPATDMADKMNIPPRVITHIIRLLNSRTPYPDILEIINSQYGTK